MPTLSPRDVERAAGLVHDRLARLGPGGVLAYAELAEGLRGELCPTPAAARHRKHLHLLRAAVEKLRAEGGLEVWGKSLRDGRWRLVWVRLPGQGEPPAPEPRRKWKPKVPYRGTFHVAPSLLARVEQVILGLLKGPIEPRELLLAAHPRPLPGPGWVPPYYLACRLWQHVSLTPSTKYNVLGAALRVMARKGLLELLAQRQRHGRRRVRWVRLVNLTPGAVAFQAAPLHSPFATAELPRL